MIGCILVSLGRSFDGIRIPPQHNCKTVELNKRYREKQRALNNEQYKAKQTQYKRNERLKKKQANASKVNIRQPIDESNKVQVKTIDTNDIKDFKKSLKKLDEYLEKNAEARDLPKIKQIIQEIPEAIELVKANTNCDDLTVTIKSREAEVQRLNPKKRVIFKL